MRITGTSIQRVEDARVLTGRGRYVTTSSEHAARRVRAQPLPAVVTNVDISAARRARVVAVLTAADLQQMTNPMTFRCCPG
jgi:CO/xanthine dehydrogenase Mo-binding subunit